MDAIEQITADYAAALAELIEHYAGAAPVVRAEPLVARGGIGAVVGFADGAVKGSSVLVGDPAAVGTLAPEPGADPRDWLGELNNQVVGRLKNKLVPWGLMLHMSPPVTADGDGLRFGALSAQNPCWAVTWPGGALRAQMALTVAPGLVLNPDESAAVAEEGSLSLF